MRVLVTGGTGTVGGPVARELRREGHDVLVYAASPPGNAASVGGPEGGEIEYGDILDAARLGGVVGAFAPEVVVHAAALTPNVSMETAAPDRIFEVNTVGSLRAISALSDAGGGRFVQLSSVAAYGDAVERATILREHIDDGAPRNLYELSKAAAESAVLRAGALRGIPVTCLRLGDVFGPGEMATPYRPIPSGPYQVTALAAAGNAVRLPSAGRREWVHTADVAVGVRLVVETQRAHEAVMNVGSGLSWTLLDWCRLLQNRWPAVRYGIDTQDPNVTLASPNPPLELSRMRALGFEPRWGLAETFDEYLTWWGETHDRVR